MTRGLFGSMAALLAGTGLALAQAPAPPAAPPGTTAALPGAGIEVGPGSASAYMPGGVPGGAINAMGLTPGGPGEVMSFGGGCPTCGGGGCASCGLNGSGVGPGCLTKGGCPSGGCGYGDCEHGDCSNPCYRIWAESDYILWRIRTAGIPSLFYNQPLGTITVPQVISSGASTGSFVINQQIPVLLQESANNTGANLKDQPGMQFRGGIWFDDEQCLGVDTSFFWLFRKTVMFYNEPVPSPTGQNFTLLIPTGFSDQIGVQGAASGAGTVITVPVNILVNVNSSSAGRFSSELWGFDSNLRCRKCFFGCITIDGLIGFRYLNLSESLMSQENLSLDGVQNAQSIPANGAGVPAIPPTGTNGVQFNGTIVDNISTQNRFYGAQTGFNWDWCMGGGVFMDGFCKLAIGDMHEGVNLQGFTVSNFANPTGLPVVFAGGNLVGPGDNNTRRIYDRIAFIPELTLNLGYQPCSWFRAWVGYDYMWVTSLMRPGDQVTQTSSTAVVTIGSAQAASSVIAPAFRVNDSQFWVQGLTMGIEFRY